MIISYWSSACALPSYERRLVVLVHDHRQAVGQGELLVRDGDLGRSAAGVSEHQPGREAAADGGRQGEAENGGAGAAEVGKGHGHSCAGMNGGIVPPS